MIFYNFSNSNSGTIPVFSEFDKKMVKFSVKIPWHFDMMLLILSICLFNITHMDYDYRLQKLFKVLREKKCKKQDYVYCDYNDISMIYINSTTALLRVRIH